MKDKPNQVGQIAKIDFCWNMCGEDALTCTCETEKDCPALGRAGRNYKKAQQIADLYNQPQSLTDKDTVLIKDASEVTGIWDRNNLSKDSDLLAKDEIVAEASKDSTYCQLSVDICKWASRKQNEIDNRPDSQIRRKERNLISAEVQKIENPYDSVDEEYREGFESCRQAVLKTLAIIGAK